MKYLLFTLVLFGCSEPFDLESDIPLTIQQDKTGLPNNHQDTITCYFYPEQMPQFPGGLAAYYAFIEENLVYPGTSHCAEGKVFVSVDLEADGSVSNPKIVKGLHASINKAVLEVFEKMPKWIPGKSDGEPVKMRMILPVKVTFK